MTEPGRAGSRKGQPERIQSLSRDADDATYWRARDPETDQEIWLAEDVLPASAGDDPESSTPTSEPEPFTLGPSLREDLGPQRKPPADALALCNELVKLLAAAHSSDLTHGSLSTSTLHVQPSRDGRHTDRHVVATRAAAADKASDKPQARERRSEDVQALGSVMYEVLSGHKPPASLSRADRLHHQSATPWPVADLVHQCLEGDHFADATELQTAFAAATGESGRRRRSRDEPSDRPLAGRGGAFGGGLRTSRLGGLSGPARSRRLAILLGAAFLIPVALVLGVSQILGSSDSDPLPTAVESVRVTPTAVPTAVPTPPPTAVPTAVPSATPIPTPEPTVAVPVELTIAGVIPWDPGGQFAENDSAAPAAIDEDPNTAWTTEIYRTSGFGGLKDGIGLWIVLAAPAAVDSVTITSSTFNWPAEIYRFRGTSEFAELAPAERLATLSQSPRGDFGVPAASFVFEPTEQTDAETVGADPATVTLRTVEFVLEDEGAATSDVATSGSRDPSFENATTGPDTHLLLWITDTGLLGGAFGTSIEEVSVSGTAAGP